MAQHIHKCQKCSKYTLERVCCNEKTILVMPAKYSPDDRYAKYRRQAKKEERKKLGLLK